MNIELPKYHKTNCLLSWNGRGVKHHNFDALYSKYIQLKNCEICNAVFKNSKDKCLDHCHKTGEFRYVLCRSCNLKMDRKINRNNQTGHIHIGYYQPKKRKPYYYIKISEKGKYVLNTKRKTLEDAIICRNNFLQNSKIYYPNLNLDIIKIKEHSIINKNDIPMLPMPTPV